MAYVRYMGQGEVVSASTDSTLRLWDARTLTPQRTYDGHVNEKNFVGLSVEGSFIACGSETNEVSHAGMNAIMSGAHRVSACGLHESLCGSEPSEQQCAAK